VISKLKPNYNIKMPTQLENTTWYTIQEVATILGKSEGTIYNRVKAGLIPVSVMLNQQVVSHDDLLLELDRANLPETIISYRLGELSPKTGEKLQPQIQ
jgi:predicted DNA-binding transcriptional regulator AlpA